MGQKNKISHFSACSPFLELQLSNGRFSRKSKNGWMAERMDSTDSLTLPHKGGGLIGPPNYFSRIVPLMQIFRPSMLFDVLHILWNFHGHWWKIGGAVTFSPKVVWHKSSFYQSLYKAPKFKSAIKSRKLMLLTWNIHRMFIFMTKFGWDQKFAPSMGFIVFYCSLLFKHNRMLILAKWFWVSYSLWFRSKERIKMSLYTNF